MESSKTSSDTVRRFLLLLAIATTAAVAVICAPGLKDGVIARLPAGLPLWLLWGTTDAVELPKYAVTWTLSPLLIAVGLACARWPVTNGAVLRILALSLLYLMLAILSTALSVLPFAGVEETVTLLCVAGASLALALGLGRERMTRLLCCNAAVGGFIAVYALCQHLDWDPLAWSPLELVRERSIGTLGNPDFLASYLVTVLPLCILAAFRSSERSGAWGAVAGVVLVAIIFSYTRGAWIALLLEAALGVAWSRKAFPVESPQIRRACVSFALVTVLLMGAFWCLEHIRPPSDMNLTRRVGETLVPTDASTTTRLALWHEAILVTMFHAALGTGPGTFTYVARPFRYVEPPLLLARPAVPGDPHNTLLEVGAASGLSAFFALLGTIGLTLRRMIGGNPGLELEGRCLVAATAAFWLAHLFVRMTVDSLWLGWMLVGIAVADVSTPVPPRKSRVAVAMVVGLVASCVAGFLSFTMLRADYYLNLAEQYSHQVLTATTPADGRLLMVSLQDFSEALSEPRVRTSWSARRASIMLRQGKVLEAVYGRSTPQMRQGAEGEFWRRMRADAEHDYRAALRANPLDPYAWHDLARFLILCAMQAPQEATSRRSIEEEGIQASRRGCQLDPYNAYLWGEHAQRCALVGDRVEARQAFEHSLELAPQQSALRASLDKFLMEPPSPGGTRR